MIFSHFSTNIFIELFTQKIIEGNISLNENEIHPFALAKTYMYVKYFTKFRLFNCKLMYLSATLLQFKRLFMENYLKQSYFGRCVCHCRAIFKFWLNHKFEEKSENYDQKLSSPKSRPVKKNKRIPFVYYPCFISCIANFPIEFKANIKQFEINCFIHDWHFSVNARIQLE